MRHLRSTSLTDIGLSRNNNEDFCCEYPSYGFYVLADGMGGHSAGEVASREAASFLSYSTQEYLLGSTDSLTVADVCSQLNQLYQNTNSWVYSFSKISDAHKGMGTTLCSLHFHGDSAIVCNVGDSRVYLLRDNTLHQLTKDHSLINDLLAEGRHIEAAHAKKNVVTMAIGTSLQINPQIEVVSTKPGDVYLLCSDGLSDYVDENAIRSALSDGINLTAKAQSLIALAKKKQSGDNITVVLVEVCDKGNSLPR